MKLVKRFWTAGLLASLLAFTAFQLPGQQSGAVFANAGMSASPVLTHGGLVGAVTDKSVKIWARADRAAVLEVQYKRPSQAWPGTTSDCVCLAAAQDFTGAVTLYDLTANTTFDYRLLLNDVIQPGSQASFKTLPSTGVPGTFTFAIGGDTGFDKDAPYFIFDKIRQKNPDFMILMGDQIYYDIPKDNIADSSKAAYESKYRENWAEVHWRDFTKHIPVFMIWDDHEIINDWHGGKGGRYLNAKLAYDEYQGKHNPAPRAVGENYYSFRVGEVDFYVLDTRSFRNWNKKTMLGKAQKADFKNWLSSSKAKFKFIVSSVPWNECSTTGNDSWQGFKTERNEIFHYIRDQRLRGIVLLSGDQHWTGIFRLEQVAPYYLYEFSPTPLGRFNRPLNENANCEPQILFMHSDTANDTPVYGFFEINTTATPAWIKFEVNDGENKSLYSLKITENNISPP